jgi:sorbitol/mannitol transport system permease protein
MARTVTPARKTAVTIAAWTIGLLIFFPILWVIILGFKSEGDAIKAPLAVLTAPWTLESYAEVQERSDYLRHFSNSVIISLGSTLIALAIAIPAAWSMAFIPGRRTKDLLMWMLSTKMMPAVGVLIPMYLMFRDTGLLDSRIGMVGVMTLINLPIVVWMLYTYFKEIPGEILEAARMDGAGEWRIFWMIVLPLLKPVIVTLAVFGFLGSWNDFMWPLIVLTDADLHTLPVAIASLSREHVADGELMMAGAVVTVMPVLLLFLALQKHYMAGLMMGGVK